MGVEEPPCHDRRGHQEQAEHLVAAVETALFGPPFIFGGRLRLGVDSAVNHGFSSLLGFSGRPFRDS
jgi:hypothetical protein